MKPPKPRSTVCWHCGKRLYQHKVFVELTIDGYPRILHKACARTIEAGDEEE